MDVNNRRETVDCWNYTERCPSVLALLHPKSFLIFDEGIRFNIFFFKFAVCITFHSWHRHLFLTKGCPSILREFVHRRVPRNFDISGIWTTKMVQTWHIFTLLKFGRRISQCIAFTGVWSYSVLEFWHFCYMTHRIIPARSFSFISPEMTLGSSIGIDVTSL